jgi:glycosyltransferase involved in cell wall biosynthesis
MEISCVILTRNEEVNLPACLKSVDFCDEIILVDDFSNDRTAEIIQNLKVKDQKFNSKIKTFQRSLNEDFAAQRNFGLLKAGGDWVLFVDADERVTPNLKKEILSAVKNKKGIDGYFFKRSDFLWGKKLKYGEPGRVKLLRLARAGTGKWRRPVHEVWQVAGKTRVLTTPLLHYPHQSLDEFIENINDFSTLHAEANYREAKRSTLAKIIVWPTGKFVYNYVILLGFLDGTRGFVHAMFMSLHSFLAWGKLWKIKQS